MTARKWAIFSLSCVILFALIMHWPVFLQGKTISAFDLSYFGMGAYKAERPADLERPSNGLLSDPVVMYQVWDELRYRGLVRCPWLWNPYCGSGSPLLANAESTAFFPLKVLAYAPAGPRKGFGYLCFLKVLLAGMLMWAYLRRLGAGAVAGTIGGLAFMASGFMIAWLQWAHTNVALTVPLVFTGCEDVVERKLKRGFLFISLATAVGLLGGHPETSLHLAFAAAVYTAARLFLPAKPGAEKPPALFGARLVPLGVLGAAIAAGALIAAVQIVPMLEYIGRSARLEARAAQKDAGPSGSFFQLPSLRHARGEFVSYLLPNTYGNPRLHSHWWKKGSNFNESAGYVGLGGLFLGLLAWRWCLRDRRILSLCVVQVISLGFVLDVPQITSTLGRLPLLDLAANKRFLLLWCFSTAALAGLAFDHIWKSKAVGRTSIGWAAAIGALFVALATYDFARRFAPNPEEWIRAYGRRQMLHFALFLAPWFCVLLLPRLRERRRVLLAAALAVVLGADLYLIHFGYNPFIRADRMYPSTDAIEFLQRQEAPVRTLAIGDEIGPNMPAVYGLQDARLYDAEVDSAYYRFLSHVGCVGGWRIVREPDLRFCSLGGIRYLWGEPGWAPDPAEAVEIVYEDDVSAIWRNNAALPLAYVSRRWRAVASPEQAYALLAQEDFPWDSTVTVEPGAGRDVPPCLEHETRAFSQAILLNHLPRSVTVALPDESAGLLVLSDCFYPGWQAFVGKERRPIFRVNGTFRGVFLKPGDTRVLFTYKPASFRYGLILSVAGVVIFVLVLLGPLSAFRRLVRITGRRAR